MHLLRPLRHIARTSAIRAARVPVALSRPSLVRGLLTQSRDRGSSDPPLITQTIPEYFRDVVSEHGDRPA
ncbi:hypothetical protein E4T44_08567 [Aureobasidium sp. EXF-8845]|nr:hypothetical protein E4T44_08567 [Aureobasidium sp. EXF-8845]KAI4843684.1 hypothetical protein E4T45_08499 [Aureobasidium sp. EXF-8846]